MKLSYHPENFFLDAQKRQIHYRIKKPQEPKALLIIQHGFAEHSAMYKEIAEQLYHHQIATYMMDLPGFGFSEGIRGDIVHFREYLNNLTTFIHIIKNMNNMNLPCFLAGHSMGGLISALYAKQSRTINGLVLIAPLTGFPLSSYLKIKTFAYLAALRHPDYLYPTTASPKSLTRDQSQWRKILSDPLRTRTISPRLFLEMDKYIHYLQITASQIELPVLIFQGLQDRVVSAQATQRFFSKLKSNDKSYITFAQARHALHHEIERDQLTNKMLHWINEQIK